MTTIDDRFKPIFDNYEEAAQETASFIDAVKPTNEACLVLMGLETLTGSLLAAANQLCRSIESTKSPDADLFKEITNQATRNLAAVQRDLDIEANANTVLRTGLRHLREKYRSITDDTPQDEWVVTFITTLLGDTP